MSELIPYCTKCDYINDSTNPCWNCGNTGVELREEPLMEEDTVTLDELEMELEQAKYNRGEDFGGMNEWGEYA